MSSAGVWKKKKHCSSLHPKIMLDVGTGWTHVLVDEVTKCH